MKDFDSLVGIWNEQKTAPQIDYKEVINQYKKSREKLSLKFFQEILLMLPAIFIVIYLWINISFSFWTSYLGLSIVAGCCIYFIVIQLINIKNIVNSNTLFDKPQDHIQFLQKFRKSRYIQHTRNYKIYSIALGLGISLYFIEFFYSLNIWIMLGIVTATIAWFVICYMYLMKIYINKEEKRFTEMIENLERLSNQFKDEI
ncbi:hypothetical protein A5893_09770 [Pedobacter psychrophilus]|uniref:Uncharacterized protein n=1 Tax=Pedobacter psychrophilus TaxID=1826909 RepID=A0A179DFW7_9SPHI|nr:hypothetical protein [Pedobacter psychrophilus]OAQ39848.1 hypothetical protein A5893_09770 [Pedobacter psychrophilus]